MSWQPAEAPICSELWAGAPLIVEPRARDLGGFSVRRVLPSPRQRSVGPFVFFDHMGPADFTAGEGLDIPPHPHIGLATVTYLFEGEIVHRDGTGAVQTIRPGALNWMTAGRGIAHSERSSPEERSRPSRLHGIQSWIALPREQAEVEPVFVHHPAEDLPQIVRDGARLRLIAGSAYGARAPVEVPSPLFYLEAELEAGATLALPDNHIERGLYLVEGEMVLPGGAFLGAGSMAVFEPDDTAGVEARQPSRLMLLGGSPLDAPRRMWWNFVATSRERIEQAKADWRAGRFAAVPGEREALPLPEM